jgi:hypothetical protein
MVSDVARTRIVIGESKRQKNCRTYIFSLIRLFDLIEQEVKEPRARIRLSNVLNLWHRVCSQYACQRL